MGKIVILASIVAAVVAISIISGLLLKQENIQNSDTNTSILELEKNQQTKDFVPSELGEWATLKQKTDFFEMRTVWTCTMYPTYR